MGIWFLGSDETVLKLHNSVGMLKTTELHTLKGEVLWREYRAQLIFEHGDVSRDTAAKLKELPVAKAGTI